MPRYNDMAYSNDCMRHAIAGTDCGHDHGSNDDFTDKLDHQLNDRIPCVGGCGRSYTSLEILDGRVMKVMNGPNKDHPICGGCLQKQTHGKNGIPEIIP